MRPRGLLAGYLASVGEVLDRLAREKEAPLAPATSLFLLAFLSCTAAFTSPLPLRPGSVLPICLALLLAALARELRVLIRALGLASAWLGVVVLPLLFLTPGSSLYALEVGPIGLAITWEGATRALEFALRCLNALAIGVAWTGYVGLGKLLRGLSLLDPSDTLPTLAFLTARYVPLTTREACRLLAAREARLMSKSALRPSWLVLASCCGELLLRAYNRAWRVGLAMRARSLTGHPMPLRLGHEGPTALDALWLLIAGVFCVLYVTRVV